MRLIRHLPHSLIAIVIANLRYMLIFITVFLALYLINLFIFNRLTWHLFDSYYLVEARGINEIFPQVEASG